MSEELKELYLMIQDYASENDLDNTENALRIILKSVHSNSRFSVSATRTAENCQKCLEVCKMLIDLHMDLSQEEEDVLLAAVILHIFLENYHRTNLAEMLNAQYEFNQDVYEIIELLTFEHNLSQKEQRAYYEKVQSNKLALLASLAYRGNIIQHLHEYSTWNAHRYIEETKACYYPMCIYGKENYHELLAPISVLLEKIRCLLEVAEIMLRKYEVRESELIQDILDIREENATVRGIIRKFREG